MTGKAGDEKWGAAEVTSGAPEITPLKLKPTCPSSCRPSCPFSSCRNSFLWVTAKRSTRESGDGRRRAAVLTFYTGSVPPCQGICEEFVAGQGEGDGA